MATLDRYQVLRLRFHFPKYDPDEWVMPYLQLAGFGDVVLIRRFDLRVNLISALVEWWCTKTHTFIMPCGECTITLEDVAMQLGLRVGDAVVTGRSKVLEPLILCHRLFGRSPSDREHNFTCLTLAWLKANFKKLSSTAIEHEMVCAAQAYIMQLIGGTYAEQHV
ncbi:protein MAIN-LIKE 1-like [Gossypium hirsutum]|uniref:Protein MAIN-LIKE 1-like n=1 Tax=Gossypium hirsutum TaxID=3635 RepID=A0A1U8PW64_GOSHI|nr:protein MAIN-LIKE 1-like [Gossypium hirsutum]